MKISMYLGSSKHWWAYLACRSNPSIFAGVSRDADCAIFFDEIEELPHIHTLMAGRKAHYFFLFWDGLWDHSLLVRARAVLGPKVLLKALVVGELHPCEGFEAAPLFAESPLVFHPLPYPCDTRTTAILLQARVKTFLMPFKNIRQKGVHPGQGLSLLCGRKRVLFCGLYGMTEKIVDGLCRRHQIDFQLFASFSFFSGAPSASFAQYLERLRGDGRFLASLVESSAINEGFFFSAIHLLGREYFIERMLDEKFDLYVNGYTTGINVNVYTTPFYAQHIYPDFGSAAGRGAYPRMADLSYFKKKSVRVDLYDTFGHALSVARAGTLPEYFDQEWQRKGPVLRRMMQ